MAREACDASRSEAPGAGEGARAGGGGGSGGGGGGGGPLGWLGSYVRSFTPGAMPRLSRRNYLWELRAATLVPMMLACVEGNVVGVIAKKGFIDPLAAERGSDAASLNYVVAVLATAGPLAMITSVFWTRVFHGRDRVRCTVALQAVVGLCVLLIALAPFSMAGLAMLVVGTLVGRSAMTGIITARSDLWRANYPRTDRARATGRITILTTLIVSSTSVLIAAAMDVESLGGHGYRIVCGAALAVGFGGVWAMSRVVWRGRAAHLSAERSPGRDPRSTPGPGAMLRVLRDDRVYRRFMITQFILGAPNLAGQAVFVVALEEMFTTTYTRSMILTAVLPILMPVLTIPLWARFLDRVHVIRFRVFHSWFFVIANGLTGLGFVLGEEWLLFVARASLGVAFGGGMLAWSLGHHDFATRELASIYMGIHATLTGVRGAIAPFVGTVLYQGVTVAGPLLGFVLPSSWAAAAAGWGGLGGGAFFVLAAVGAIAALLFLKLDRDLRTRRPTE